jgi:hypothetical protein
MSPRGDSGVPTSSGIPAIIVACALGVPSAAFFAFVGMWNSTYGTFSVLTLPSWSIMGACLGAGAGGLVALLCGCHLRRGFCCIFCAPLGSVGGMVLTSVFFPTLPTRDDPNQLLKDAVVLGATFLGVLGGAAVRRFVTRFGGKSRVWAGISAGVFFSLGAAYTYAFGETLDLANNPGYIVFLLPEALIAASVGGSIGALAGAIRDSA